MENTYDTLSRMLNLSPYQARMLRGNENRYDISRIVMDNGVLTVPLTRRGIYSYAISMLRGRAVDVIGRDRVIARGMRAKTGHVSR